MTNAALLVFTLGLLTIVVGYIWIFLEAFQVSIAWGLGCLLIPGISIVFACINPDRAIKPLLVLMTGVILALGPFGLGLIFTE